MKLLLLLSVGLGLTWTLQDETHLSVLKNFRPEEVVGSWYTYMVASTDRSVIEERGAHLCLMADIVLLDNGNLNVTYFCREDGNCVKKFYIAEKTDTRGRYTFEYQGKNYLTFAVVSEDLTIMDFECMSGGNTFIMSKLRGRSRYTRYTDGLRKVLYYSHVFSRGITPENIVDLSSSPRCDN